MDMDTHAAEDQLESPACVLNQDVGNNCDIFRVKIEDEEIYEQLTNEIGIFDTEGYTVKSEYGLSDLSHPVDYVKCPLPELVENQQETDFCYHNSVMGRTMKNHSNLPPEQKQLEFTLRTSAKNHRNSRKSFIIRQYKCSFCDYAANRKPHLKVHINSVHLNLKQHKCHFCDFASSWKNCLKQHINSIHLNLKPYKCQFCDYSANQKKHLQYHMDSAHLNTKHYKCPMCDYEVIRKCNLKMHIRSVHLKMKKHKCHLCKYDTNRKNHLVLHLNSVHLNMK